MNGTDGRAGQRTKPLGGGCLTNNLIEFFPRVDDEFPTIRFEGRVLLQVLVEDAVDHGIEAHADVEIGVTQPLHSLVHVGDGAQSHLGDQVAEEMTKIILISNTE